MGRTRADRDRLWAAIHVERAALAAESRPAPEVDADGRPTGVPEALGVRG